MITRSRAKQIQQVPNTTELINIGLKYEEVQRLRKQNRCFSWFKFLLSSTAFIAACYASMKVAQDSGTNIMASIYDFTERTKESFITIPYKIPGISFIFGADSLASPSVPWIVLEGSLTSDHLLYEPNSSIQFSLRQKQGQYDNLTETIYQSLIQKTNYETIMADSQDFLKSLPQIRHLYEEYAQQKQIVANRKSELCKISLWSSICATKQTEYTKSLYDLEELRTLRSYTFDVIQFPNLFFTQSKFLSSFPKLPINASAFQTLVYSREALLSQTIIHEPQDLFKLASRFTYPQIGSNSTLLQHTLNSLLSPLIQRFSQVLAHLYRKQSNLLSQIGILQTAYTSTMVEKQYEDAIKEWDAFVTQCSEQPNPVCSIATSSNRNRLVDIVFELRTNQLPLPENFQVLAQRIFLNPERYQNATARDLARVIRVEKYKKNPDPYTLLFSGSLGFLVFSGSYYVFFDRLSTILYALTIPFDMIISWGENWIRRQNFKTQQFLETELLLLPDVPTVPAERTQLVPKNTHKA